MKKNNKDKTRNYLAIYAWEKSGAGPHKDKKRYSRKEKHKKSYEHE